jgi:hypothetical protein
MARARTAHKRPTRAEILEARRLRLVGNLARLMRQAHETGAVPTCFGLEGTLRAGLRSRLCLMGSPWRRADVLAMVAVRDALWSLRARRPTWVQGQPDYAMPAAIEPTRCINCGHRLPEGHRSFCGKRCSTAFNMRVAYSAAVADGAAVRELAGW